MNEQSNPMGTASTPEPGEGFWVAFLLAAMRSLDWRQAA
jgi:hypothetical protein